MAQRPLFLQSACRVVIMIVAICIYVIVNWKVAAPCRTFLSMCLICSRSNKSFENTLIFSQKKRSCNAASCHARCWLIDNHVVTVIWSVQTGSWRRQRSVTGNVGKRKSLPLRLVFVSRLLFQPGGYVVRTSCFEKRRQGSGQIYSAHISQKRGKLEFLGMCRRWNKTRVRERHSWFSIKWTLHAWRRGCWTGRLLSMRLIWVSISNCQGQI